MNLIEIHDKHFRTSLSLPEQPTDQELIGEAQEDRNRKDSILQDITEALWRAEIRIYELLDDFPERAVEMEADKVYLEGLREKYEEIKADMEDGE